MAAGSAGNRVIEVPPALLSTRKKTDELFLQWLTEKETRQFVREISNMATSSSRCATIWSSSNSASLLSQIPTSTPVLTQAVSLSQNPSMGTNKVSRASKPLTPELVTSTAPANERIDNLLSLWESSASQSTPPLLGALAEFAQVPYVISPLVLRAIQSQDAARDSTTLLQWWHRTLSNSDVAFRIANILISARPGSPVNLNETEPELYLSDWYTLGLALIETVPSLARALSTPSQQDDYARFAATRLFFSLSTAEISDSITLEKLRGRRSQSILLLLSAITRDTPAEKLPELLALHTFELFRRDFASLELEPEALRPRALVRFPPCRSHLRYALAAYTHVRIRRPLPGSSQAVTSSSTKGAFSFTQDPYAFEDFVLLRTMAAHPASKRAISLWFLCADRDGDGALMQSDLLYYYENQLYRQEELLLPPVLPEPLFLYLIQRLQPVNALRITLSDLWARKAQAAELYAALFDLDALFKLPLPMTSSPASTSD